MSSTDEIEQVQAVIDCLAARFAEPPLDREIAAARSEFDRRRGAVCDDESLFESHVAAFLEWYVLERPGADGRPPVVSCCLTSGAEGGLPGSARLLRALALSHHSLFEVVDPRLDHPPGVRILDLVGGGLWRVDQPAHAAGLVRGDIFEARLIPWEDRVWFGPVFCYHPREAHQSIHDLVERQRREGTLDRDLVLSLARMRLNWSRSRNLPAERVYRREGARP